MHQELTERGPAPRPREGGDIRRACARTEPSDRYAQSRPRAPQQVSAGARCAGTRRLSRPHRRSGLALTLAVLVATALPALAGDATKTHKAGYPRASDTPPASLSQAPEGSGDENTEGDGVASYDTNWLIDASAGDSNVVLLEVWCATITGFGHVADADDSAASSKRKEAWGEDRLICGAPASANSYTCTVTVTNTIRFSGSWYLAGNGRNQALLHGRALDILDRQHEWKRTFDVDPATSATVTGVKSAGVEGSTGTGGNVGTDGASVSGSNGTTGTASAATVSTVRVASGSAVNGSDSTQIIVTKTWSGEPADVRIASAALLDLQAQAIVDGVETTVKVAEFKVENTVDASYTIDPPPPPGGGGGGTPGGEDTGGPGTGPAGGGDPGGAPTPPGGGTPPAPGGTPPGPGGPPPAPGGTPPGPVTPPAPGGTPGGPTTGGDGAGTAPGTPSGGGTEPPPSGASEAGGGGSLGGGAGTGSSGGSGTGGSSGSAPGSGDGTSGSTPLGGSQPGGSLNGGTTGGQSGSSIP